MMNVINTLLNYVGEVTAKAEEYFYKVHGLEVELKDLDHDCLLIYCKNNYIIFYHRIIPFITVVKGEEGKEEKEFKTLEDAFEYVKKMQE